MTNAKLRELDESINSCMDSPVYEPPPIDYDYQEELDDYYDTIQHQLLSPYKYATKRDANRVINSYFLESIL